MARSKKKTSYNALSKKERKMAYSVGVGAFIVAGLYALYRMMKKKTPSVIPLPTPAPSVLGSVAAPALPTKNGDVMSYYKTYKYYMDMIAGDIRNAMGAHTKFMQKNSSMMTPQQAYALFTKYLLSRGYENPAAFYKNDTPKPVYKDCSTYSPTSISTCGPCEQSCDPCEEKNTCGPCNDAPDPVMATCGSPCDTGMLFTTDAGPCGTEKITKYLGMRSSEDCSALDKLDWSPCAMSLIKNPATRSITHDRKLDDMPGYYGVGPGSMSQTTPSFTHRISEGYNKYGKTLPLTACASNGDTHAPYRPHDRTSTGLTYMK